MKKMKNMKKLVGILLALVMVFGMTITAFAAGLGTGTGSITISNATVGQTYTIYKIFDTDATGKGNITATAEQKTWFEGKDGNPFVFEQNAAGTYNVSVGKNADNATYTDAEVIAFLQGFVTKDASGNVTVDSEFENMFDSKTSDPATSAEVKFENIPYGYYLVTSTLGATVTVNATNPSVTVIDKNQTGPNWGDEGGKTSLRVNDQPITPTTDGKISANYGDVIDFQVKFNTTNYNGENKILEYYVNDTLASGMSYELVGGDGTDKDNVALEVKVGEKQLTSGYRVEMLTNADGTTGFKLTIDWYDETNGFAYVSPNTITVNYSAKVTNTAAIANDGNVNTATYSYKDEKDGENPDPSHESEEQTITTYVYALGFHKIAADTKASLSGAEFSIQKGDTVIGAVKNVDGTYSYTSDATAEGYTTTFVSDANGLIVVKGLAAGDYIVTETKAPDGYNKLEKTVTISASIEKTESYTETTTTYYDENGNKVAAEVQNGTTVTATYEVPVSELIVENNTGSLLPTTGGMGTTIFYIIGGILVFGAVVVLVTRRRMNMGK